MSNSRIAHDLLIRNVPTSRSRSLRGSRSDWSPIHKTVTVGVFHRVGDAWMGLRP